MQAQHELARAALARGELTGNADDVEFAAAVLTGAGRKLFARRLESDGAIDGAVSRMKRSSAATTAAASSGEAPGATISS